MALVHEILSPYREPLFTALAHQEWSECTVIHVARTEARRDWDIDFPDLPYPWRYVPALALHTRRLRATWFVPRGLGRTLDDLDPDVVIVPGYATPASLGALGWTRRRRRALVMWSEGSYARSLAVTERLKQAFTGACDSYIVPGQLAREHLEELGADPAAIHLAPNCIDLDLFRPTPKAEGDVRRFVCCAQLEPRKGLDVAIRALDRADPERRAELLLVGQGSQRERLEALGTRLGVRVTFAGSVQYGEVAHQMQSADAFVFPTRNDIWGFALQEAAASGLPLVSSVYAGATRELVTEGVTGWSVLPEPESVALGLRRLLDLPPEARYEMGRAARAAAERLSVEAAVGGFRKAVEAAVARRPARHVG